MLEEKNISSPGLVGKTFSDIVKSSSKLQQNERTMRRELWCEKREKE